MTCHVCGNAISEDDDNSTTITYNGRDYDFCGEHNNDAYIITDYDDNQAPIPEGVTTAYFDGESSRPNHNGRLYLEEPADDHFCCAICDSMFYGYGSYVEDTGDVCAYCLENACWFDDEEELYYRNEGGAGRGCTPRQGQSNGFRTFIGEPTERFLAAPTIGFEFEHAPVRRGERHADEAELYEYIIRDDHNRERFLCHYDGSIANMGGYSAKEIVSMPASGKEIEDIISAFYAPFASGRFSPGPEHPTCGFHIHVASRFLRLFWDGMSASDVPMPMRRAAIGMLGAINTICREYISSSRRSNSYCNDVPSVRDKNMGKPGSHQLVEIYGSYGYPSIAVRTIGTIEFRLWPSSNSIRYTTARAELSQKMVKYYDDCLVDDTGKLSLDEEKSQALTSLAGLCRGGARITLTDKLAELLGLSEKCKRDLARMSERFNPFSHKKTAFRFTDIQVSTMMNESSLSSTDYIRPDGADIETVGDTTLETTDKDLYISFGAGVRCYPATGTGDQLEAVTQLAKGDI